MLGDDDLRPEPIYPFIVAETLYQRRRLPLPKSSENSSLLNVFLTEIDSQILPARVRQMFATSSAVDELFRSRPCLIVEVLNDI